MIKRPTFLFTGGGTGGHVYPNIAIYEALKQHYPEADFCYIGTKKGAENKIIRTLAQPMAFHSVSAKGIPQKIRSAGTLLSLIHILWGTIKSCYLLKRIKPTLIIGTGSYVAAPVFLAAALSKTPVFVHEQNAVPGRLNQFIARYATKIGVSYPSTARYFPSGKVVYTGYPLRHSILSKPTENIRQKLNIPEKNKVLLVISGSMGARTINQAMAEIIPNLLTWDDLSVIISTGKCYSKTYRAYDDMVTRLGKIGIAPEIEGKLIVREYFDNMDEMYAIADLVISRAGAGAIKEITSLGVPSLLVPKLDLPGDHQILNAREIEKIGGTRIIHEEIGSKKNNYAIHLPECALLKTIRETLYEDDHLLYMKKNLKQVEKLNSTELILEQIEHIIQREEEVGEKALKVYFLHSLPDELDYEISYPATTLGNTRRADIFLENIPGKVLGELIVSDAATEKETLLLRHLQGEIAIDGIPLRHARAIRAGANIEFNHQPYLLKSQLEKVRSRSFPGCSATADQAGKHSLLMRSGEFLRDILTGALFGAGKAVDIFAASKAVIDLFVALTKQLLNPASFLPLFQSLFRRGNTKKAWEFSAATTNVTILLSSALTVLGMILAPTLLRLLIPGFAAKSFLLEGTTMLRIMLPCVFLAATTGYLSINLQSFSGPLISENILTLLPVVSMLGTLLLFSQTALFSLAYGVLAGWIFAVLFLLPFVIKLFVNPALTFHYSIKASPSSAAGRKHFSRVLPPALISLLENSSPLVCNFLASGLATNAISYLYFARAMFALPFTAVQRFVIRHLQQEFSADISLLETDRAKRWFIAGVNIQVFLLGPISVLLVVMARPLVSLLLERFHFNALAVTRTTLAVQFYAIGMIGWGISEISERLLVNRRHPNKALLLNALQLVGQILLALLLMRTPLRYAGIALASSITYIILATLRVGVVTWQLQRENAHGQHGEILDSTLKTSAALILMTLVISQAKFLFNRIFFHSAILENLFLTISLSFIGIAIFFLSSLILKNSCLLIFRKSPDARIEQLPLSMLPPSKFLEVVAKNPDFYQSEYRYKINIYLANPSWVTRNVGIKLIGLFRDKSKSGFLLDALNGRERNGFIRRNALNALLELNIWNAEIQEILKRLLHDSYYEVRVAAINYLIRHMNIADFSHFRPLIQYKLRQAPIEEKLACLRLIARKGDRADLADIQSFFLTSNSLLREEIVELLYNFYRRNLIDENELKLALPKILVTSNHFSPEYRIKSIIQRIGKEIAKP